MTATSSLQLNRTHFLFEIDDILFDGQQFVVDGVLTGNSLVLH